MRPAFALVPVALFALGVGASGAQPAERSGQVTISLLTNSPNVAAYGVLIPNFERVYPNITVNVTFASSLTNLVQLETTEIAAGNGPDLISTYPGCGQGISVCVFAKAGDLAPLVREPWVKRSLPLVTSLDKYGQGLFAFTTYVAPWAVLTNDALFAKLGLKIPQSFPQLLDLCHQAQADGVAALIASGPGGISGIIKSLDTTTVYAQDPHWNQQLNAGKATFDGTPGWHQALQDIIDLNNAGCFQPGAAGTSTASANVEFAQGQGLMIDLQTGNASQLAAAEPQFSYSAHPFPSGSNPNQTNQEQGLYLSLGLSINAHSSAQNQAAAQTFIDFMARPKQNALYAKLDGGLTQYQFLKKQFPAFMSSFVPVQAFHPDSSASGWWNPAIENALFQDAIGLITGQSTVDGILQAMDAAWEQGPS